MTNQKTVNYGAPKVLDTSMWLLPSVPILVLLITNGGNGDSSSSNNSNNKSPDDNTIHDNDDSDVDDEDLDTPIHILIASFRDQLCPRTLHNAFTHAQNPDRLYIRIIEQRLLDSDLVDDAGCFARYCTEYSTPEDCAQHTQQQHVRTVLVDARQAKGPTDARSKLSAMIHWDYRHRQNPSALDFHPVQLQDFCMQIDSHMDFSDHFDTELIRMHHRTQNDYAVLSTYVADISQNNRDIRVVPNLCMVTFTSTIRNWGTKECRNLVRPKLTNAMWGAGLSFHRCHAELVVPVDPYLDNVFDGEEGSRGIRFFTHGYDVYTPDRVLVTHDYKTHQSNPVVHSWGQQRKLKGQNPAPAVAEAAHKNDDNLEATLETSWKFMQDIEAARSQFQVFGTERVNLLLGIGEEAAFPQKEAKRQEIEKIRESRFGLGNKRTLAQAIAFTGIDLVHRKMVQNKCGNLEWVPFIESSLGDYGVSEMMARIPLSADSTTTIGNPISSETGAVAANTTRGNQPALWSVDGSPPHAFANTTHRLTYLELLACAILLSGAAANRIFCRIRRRKHARHIN